MLEQWRRRTLPEYPNKSLMVQIVLLGTFRSEASQHVSQYYFVAIQGLFLTLMKCLTLSIFFTKGYGYLSRLNK